MQTQSIGYVRVSTIDQNTARQLDGLALDKIFEDKASGKDTNRAALRSMIDYAREGDVIHVHSFDRLARNLGDLKAIIETLTNKGCHVHFVKEGLTFSKGINNPMAELLLNVLGAVSQFERDLIKERQREGIEVAKREGRSLGRKASLTSVQVTEALRRQRDGEQITAIAESLGVSRQTLYTAIKRYQVK